jgi:hypothetical protein
MHGNSVCSTKMGFNSRPDGIGVDTTSSLSQRRDMINIHTQLNHEVVLSLF